MRRRTDASEPRQADTVYYEVHELTISKLFLIFQKPTQIAEKQGVGGAWNCKKSLNVGIVFLINVISQERPQACGLSRDWLLAGAQFEAADVRAPDEVARRIQPLVRIVERAVV